MKNKIKKTIYWIISVIAAGVLIYLGYKAYEKLWTTYPKENSDYNFQVPAQIKPKPMNLPAILPGKG